VSIITREIQKKIKTGFIHPTNSTTSDMGIIDSPINSESNLVCCNYLN
jgi:hypothetical protein